MPYGLHHREGKPREAQEVVLKIINSRQNISILGVWSGFGQIYARHLWAFCLVLYSNGKLSSARTHGMHCMDGVWFVSDGWIDTIWRQGTASK